MEIKPDHDAIGTGDEIKEKAWISFIKVGEETLPGSPRFLVNQELVP